MATKIILRRKSEFMNRTRGIRIFIDGVEVGKITNGNTEEYFVNPGVHTMQCKIDWCSSPVMDLTINSDESKFLELRSGMQYFGIGYILILVSLASDLLLKLAHIPRPEYFAWIRVAVIIPVILYLVYYLSLGKKNYLKLQEDTNNIFN
jgi:hypothetical protein